MFTHPVGRALPVCFIRDTATATRRLLIIATLVLLACPLGAEPARAQGGPPPQPPQTTVLDIPVARTMDAATCAPEPVALGGVMHIVIHTVQAQDGTRHSAVSVELRTVTARGVRSAEPYVLDNTDRRQQSYPCAPGEACLALLTPTFVVRGAGPDAGAPGGFSLRLDAAGSGRVAGRLAGVDFSCPQ